MTLPFSRQHVFIFLLLALPIIAIVSPRFMGPAPIICAVLGAITLRPNFKNYIQDTRRFFAFCFGLAVLIGASALWSVSPDMTIERLGKASLILISGAACIGLARQIEQPQKDAFCRYLPIVTLIMGAFCVFEAYAGGILNSLVHDYGSDDSFTITKINRSIIIFTLCFFFSLPLLLKKEGRFKYALLSALSLIMLAILYKTHSQSAQVAVAFGLIVFFAFPYRYKYAWGALKISIVALIMVAPWIAQYMFSTFPPLTQGNDWFHYSYAANRMEIWDFVARKALESPFVGHGVEATKAIKDFDTAQMYHSGTEVLHPHNFVLQIWIELGVLGAVLLSCFYVWVLDCVRKMSLEAARPFLSVFLVTTLIAAMTYGLWQSWWLGTFIIMTAYACLIFKDGKRTS